MSRNRREFLKETKRAALKRSGGKCEAVGEMYGLQERQRCNAPLSRGVHFDHVDTEAVSRDNSLENCAATCPPCNRWKAAHYDNPRAAETKRQGEKLGQGFRHTDHPFPKRIDPWGKNRRSNSRDIRDDL